MLISTAGITITKYYCGTTLENVSVITLEQEQCCNMPHGCCHKETKSYKISDDFTVTTFSFDDVRIPIQLPTVVELIQNAKIRTGTTLPDFYNTPPPVDMQTALATLQSYLI